MLVKLKRDSQSDLFIKPEYVISIWSYNGRTAVTTAAIDTETKANDYWYVIGTPEEVAIKLGYKENDPS